MNPKKPVFFSDDNQGIACGGNWIVDQVKIIDTWPQPGTLANILEETTGVGGSPANVLTDLNRLGVTFPTFGIGCIGDDPFGSQIEKHCRDNRISTEFLTTMPGEQTSYTDVMTLRNTGERTFFHCRGANALFAPEHVSIAMLKERKVRIFHLGYMLLLDTLDQPDPEFGTNAGRLLAAIQEAGIQTSLDVVSEDSDRFKQIVLPTLPYVDHCIINEIEAERTTGIQVRTQNGSIDPEAMLRAASVLLDYGVSTTVVIHAPETGLWLDRQGNELFVPSLTIPKDHIVGTVGAGDAFCAGILYGIHEGWQPEVALQIAAGTAATCITAANTTDGVRSLKEIEEICRRWASER